MNARLKSFVLMLIGALSGFGAHSAVAQSTAGEVRKVDRAQGKVTLHHEAIANLKMPAMTMAYRVQNPAWLDQLKEGDKVRFDADKVNGQYTITALSPSPTR